MRFIVPSLLIIISSIGIAATATPAAAQDYKYCLQGRQWDYPGNCAFSTYGQCMASASGTDSACGLNPRYAYARHRYGWTPYRRD
jgi:uncharacterized protein DUF3551